MKRLVLLLLAISVLCVGCLPAIVLADETNSNANQEVDIDAAGAVALFLKQPRAEENVQVIKIRRSGLVLLLSVAGKVPTQTKPETK